MNKTIKIKMVQMPNFLTMERPVRPRQEGFKPEDFTIPVSELSETEAIEYAEEMKQAFINHWKIKTTQQP